MVTEHLVKLQSHNALLNELLYEENHKLLAMNRSFETFSLMLLWNS